MSDRPLKIMSNLLQELKITLEGTRKGYVEWTNQKVSTSPFIWNKHKWRFMRIRPCYKQRKIDGIFQRPKTLFVEIWLLYFLWIRRRRTPVLENFPMSCQQQNNNNRIRSTNKKINNRSLLSLLPCHQLE